MVICGELILGAGLLINFYPRFFRLSSTAALSIFSLFLIYLLFTQGNNDNCHCFGDLVELNPLPSLLKNIGLILILILTKHIRPFKIPYKIIISVVIALIPVLIVLATNPPDNWFSNGNMEYNEEAFYEFIENNEALQNMEEIQFSVFRIGLPILRISRKKLHLIQQNNPETKMNFAGVFWGKEERLSDFQDETELIYSTTYLINPVEFLNITHGKMPIAFIFRNNQIIESLGLQSYSRKKHNRHIKLKLVLIFVKSFLE